MSNCHPVFKEREMPKLSKAETANRSVNEAEALGKVALKKLSDSEYFVLLRLLAGMLDDSRDGHDTYVIVGRTKDRTTVSVTLKLDGGSDASYGDTLAEAAAGCQRWL
jgi:hypothetical protein